MATTPISNAIALLAPDGSTLTDDFINGLVQGGAWTWAQFDPHVLTYSLNINDNGFPEGDPNLAPGPGGTWAANPAMAAAVSQALSAWSNVANIGFQQVTSGTYSFESGADLAITLTGNDLQTFVGAIGLSFFPDPSYVQSLMDADGTDTLDRTDYPKPEGDVFLDNFSPVFNYLNPGGIGLSVILHEVGHALGLKHTGDDGGNARPLFSDLGIGFYDSMQYTVMTNGIGALTPDSTGFAATPMPADILAIQRIYGANTSYHAGDDVYTLANDGVLKTIWDAGGTDTLDASALTYNVRLNLNPGAFSWHWTTPGPLGEVSTAIAYNVTIENATGGSGNDLIFGNDAANLLSGGAGNDTFVGGAGNDTYVVDAAGDVVMESPGGGTDTVLASVTYSLESQFGIEILTLTGVGNINGTGDPSDNVITGNNGDNILDGGVGNDTLNGGAGNDTYVVDAAGDVVVEGVGAGTDTVQAQISGYTLGANMENLTLTGGFNVSGTGNELDNVVSGNSFNNTLDGGAGNDTLIGGAGNDTYVVDATGDVVTEGVGAGTDTVLASATYTLGDYIEKLTLRGAGNLNGTGNGLDNVVTGNSGSNTLDGGAGNDTLYGGEGDDVYIVDSPSDVVKDGSLSTAFVGKGEFAIVSDDGSHVAFQSFAGGFQQILVKNLITGVTVQASHSFDGTSGNNDSFSPALSSDGRYVVFQSWSNNLVLGDTSTASDIFVEDLQTAMVSRVSTATDGTQASSSSGNADISADGRYVVFQSSASNLVPDDGTFFDDIFLKDLVTGTTTLVSTDPVGIHGNGGSRNPGLSADGRYVVFQSDATNLVDSLADTNNAQDLFRKDLLTGETVLVSSSSDGTLASILSNPALFSAVGSALGDISGDGRYVVFNSLADNLVAGDTNGATDVFVKDLQTGTTVRVSTASGGAQADNSSSGCSISEDGRYVVFNSNATNLDSGDTDIGFDVYVKDLQTGKTALITAPASGPKTVDFNTGISLSADGHYVVFASFANNLVVGQTNEGGGVFVSQNPLFDAGGNDEVRSSVSYALGEQLERLTLTGVEGINGTGNELDNVLTGNIGNNTLNGGAGIDTMIGGAGNDTLIGGQGIDSLAGGAGDDTDVVSVSATAGPSGIVFVSDAVTENLNDGLDTVFSSASYALPANIENLVLTGAPFWHAYTGTGNGLNNILTGQGTARHVFDGGAGNDTMFGGEGNDTYVVDAAGDVIGEGASAGMDTVLASATYTLGANIENLTLTGSSNINGTGNTLANVVTGNSGNNTLTGSAGNDTLDGGAGNDTMFGGSDNDTYVVSASGDVIGEAASAGTDTVLASATYTLGANIENLTLMGSSNINGTGNGLDNVLTGNSGNNTLNGGVGNDTLNGGTGIDVLTGGTGSDVFLFNSAPSADKILDFASGADHIDLDKAIYTVFGTTGAVNAANVQTAFESAITATSGNAGDGQDYLKYASDTGHLYYDADGTGVGGLSLIATLYSGGTTPAVLLPTQDILIV